MLLYGVEAIYISRVRVEIAEKEITVGFNCGCCKSVWSFSFHFTSPLSKSKNKKIKNKNHQQKQKQQTTKTKTKKLTRGLEEKILHLPTEPDQTTDQPTNQLTKGSVYFQW